VTFAKPLLNSRIICVPCIHTPATLEDNGLVHLSDESVDVVLTVTEITTLDEVLEFALTEATIGIGQLEGPQEVAGLLEVGADSVDLVDQVFHADDTIFAEIVLDQLVVGKSNALLVDLSVSALVDEFADRLQIGVAVGDVGVDDGEHFLGSLGELDEDTVVDLQKAQELEDLAGLGCDLVDTLDADDEGELGLLLNVEGTVLTAHASKSDLLTLGIAILLDVGFGALEDSLALLLVGLMKQISTRAPNCENRNM
jgi:hypothetical protein